VAVKCRCSGAHWVLCLALTKLNHQTALYFLLEALFPIHLSWGRTPCSCRTEVSGPLQVWAGSPPGSLQDSHKSQPAVPMPEGQH
jgi:hypothetical protein